MTGDHYRKKIEQECDKFMDLFQLSHLDSAKYINEDQVDILVDLVGHTEDNRLSICAYRPAPFRFLFLVFSALPELISLTISLQIKL